MNGLKFKKKKLKNKRTHVKADEHDITEEEQSEALDRRNRFLYGED